MDDAERFRLLHGPYAAPACRRGDPLPCEYRGRELRVLGISDGPIPWPYASRPGGYPSLIVCGDLARAVRVESEIAISHWWGIGVSTVWKWRQALGVPQVTEGTGRLYREYRPEKLTEEAYERMTATARTTEARERRAAAKLGRPAHPRTREALAAAARRPKSEEWKRQAAERARARGDRPPVANPWAPEEDRQLGTATDREIAERLGRSLPAVRSRRRQLGIPAHQSESA